MKPVSERDMIPVAKYDHLHFGMALTRITDVNSQLFAVDFMDVHGIDAMEIPFENFVKADREFEIRYRRQVYKKSICGEVLDRDLSARIPFSTKKQRDEFAEEYKRRLKVLDGWNVHCVLLDFDMESVLWDREGRINALEIINQIAPEVRSRKMNLLLTCRLPNPDGFGDASAEFCRFLRETMCPSVKAAVRIDIMESFTSAGIEKVLGPLAWEIRELILSYNADSGYRVSIDQMRIWLDGLKVYGFEGPFMIAPISNRNRMTQPEFDNFRMMVGQLRNE